VLADFVEVWPQTAQEYEVAVLGYIQPNGQLTLCAHRHLEHYRDHHAVRAQRPEDVLAVLQSDQQGGNVHLSPSAVVDHHDALGILLRVVHYEGQLAALLLHV
jgi:hypothetical protein